jgi:hypothetical protein
MLDENQRTEQGMYRIELTRGPSWNDPNELLDARDCQTDSLNACIAEAKHWLTQTQNDLPHWRATHYRVIDRNGVVIGGPP